MARRRRNINTGNRNTRNRNVTDHSHDLRNLMRDPSYGPYTDDPSQTITGLPSLGHKHTFRVYENDSWYNPGEPYTGISGQHGGHYGGGNQQNPYSGRGGRARPVVARAGMRAMGGSMGNCPPGHHMMPNRMCMSDNDPSMSGGGGRVRRTQSPQRRSQGAGGRPMKSFGKRR